MEHPSFVLGCSACLGHDIDDEAQDDLGGPQGYDFGYPQREWDRFATGGELAAVVNEEEIRARLRSLQPPLPHNGNLLECAERLLLHERGIRTPKELLGFTGVVALRQRLVAVGLDSHGDPLECAQRLLFLLENWPLESLKLWDAQEYLRPLQGDRRRRRRRQRAHKGKEQAPKAPMPQIQEQKSFLPEAIESVTTVEDEVPRQQGPGQDSFSQAVRKACVAGTIVFASVSTAVLLSCCVQLNIYAAP